jgi:TRIAD3 protein (E3 ubiquitin-protein ligase RNF216)
MSAGTLLLQVNQIRIFIKIQIQINNNNNKFKKILNSFEYRECIRRYTETIIGDSKYIFKCIDSSCQKEYNSEILKEVLSSNQYKNVIINKQNEEIKSADLHGLESCRYCTYAVIIENPDEKVFSCLNPTCMKETCRLCNEPNHLPLRCNEIEKKSESDFRTFIENKISEAMLRTCWKCSKRFYKTEVLCFYLNSWANKIYELILKFQGCNLMHCVCGAKMCYVCRAPINGYDHFNDLRDEGSINKCIQFSDVAELHKTEMEKALIEAKTKYLVDNPNAANIELKHFDPKKLIETVPARK